MAKALLGHERTMIAGMGTSDRTTSGDSLPDYAREYLDVENGRPRGPRPCATGSPSSRSTGAASSSRWRARATA